MLDHLPDLVNANEPLVRRGRFFSCTFLVGIGATDWLIKISNGRVASATSGPVTYSHLTLPTILHV